MSSELDVQSMTTVPSSTPSDMPSSPKLTAFTCCGMGRHVTTSSLPEAASAGVSAQCAPSSSMSVAASGLRSWTVNSSAAVIICLAIGLPMCPMPIHAIFMKDASVVVFFLGCQSNWRSRGSKRSRNQSPKKLNARTVSMIASPGKKDIHHSV